MNKLFLKGNIANDLVVMESERCKYTNFSIAENVSYPENKVNFYSVTAFNHKAEFICRNFKKGQPILVSGHLDTSKYIDKNGEERKSTSIIVEDVDFAGFCKNDSRAYSSANVSTTNTSSSNYSEGTVNPMYPSRYNGAPQTVHNYSPSNASLDCSEVDLNNSDAIPETALNSGTVKSTSALLPNYNGTDDTIEHNLYSAAPDGNAKSCSTVEESGNTDIEALINAALGK